MRGAFFLLIAGLAAARLAAGPADDAFDAGDYATALEIWREAAETGDAEARFNLGVLHDLGLGVERDSRRAFDNYLRAAESGHAEAQFNVAVMIDAGTVGPPDPEAAAVWYGRAAANGVARAAYNLGLLYLGGTGVARNVELARHWLAAAGETVPAAQDALERIEAPEAATGLAAPEPQGGFRVELPGGEARAELVWTAPPDGSDGPFIVQLARLPAAGEPGALPVPVETPASAVTLPLEGNAAFWAWRVLRVAPDGARYAASPWSALAPAAPEAALPRGAVRFEIGAGDTDARRLAGVLSEALAGNGLLSRIVEVDDPPEATAVRYAYETDAPLARSVAAILPDGASEPAGPGSAPALVPGEVTVALSGGLAAAGGTDQDPASQTSIPAASGAGR